MLINQMDKFKLKKIDKLKELTNRNEHNFKFDHYCAFYKNIFINSQLTIIC